MQLVTATARQTRAGLDAVSTGVSAMTSGVVSATSNVGKVTAAWWTSVAGQSGPAGGGKSPGSNGQGGPGPQQQIPNVMELSPEKVAAAIGDPAIQSVIGQPAMVMKMMSDPVGGVHEELHSAYP